MWRKYGNIKTETTITLGSAISMMGMKIYMPITCLLLIEYFKYIKGNGNPFFIKMKTFKQNRSLLFPVQIYGLSINVYVYSSV